jgi:hypothetical protein
VRAAPMTDLIPITKRLNGIPPWPVYSQHRKEGSYAVS